MRHISVTFAAGAVLAAALGIVMLAGGCGPQGPQVSRLSIFVTGHVQGYIKNCGCSSGQYGGLVRMARLLRKEREKSATQTPEDRGRIPVSMLLDIGNFTDPSTDVSRVNSDGVVVGMQTLEYDAVGLGMYELTYTQADLWALLGESGLPLTTANLEFTTPGKGEDYSGQLNELIKPYEVVELEGGLTIGVIHLIDDKVDEVIGKLNGFSLSEAGEAARGVLSAHQAEADYWVVTIADTRQRGTSPDTLAKLPGALQVIGFRHKNPIENYESDTPELPVFLDPPYRNARDVVRTVTVFGKADQPPYIKADRFAIPDTISPDDQVQVVIDDLADRLEQIELAAAEAALNAETHPFYMGHETCIKCHENIVLQQLTTPHAHAMESLREKGQDRSAACVMCHVVGHPLLPGVTGSHGWNIVENQEVMQGVHCESCHGPSEYHVVVEYAKSFDKPVPEEVLAKLSEDGRDEFGHWPLDEPEKSCLVCHDELNSPDFDFDTYWPKIEHTSDMEFVPPEGMEIPEPGGSEGGEAAETGSGH